MILLTGTLAMIIMVAAIFTSCKKNNDIQPATQQALSIKATDLQEYPIVVTKGKDVVVGVFRPSGNTANMNMKSIRVNLRMDGTCNGASATNFANGINEISLWVSNSSGNELIGRVTKLTYDGPYIGADFLEGDCFPLVLLPKGDQLIIVKMKANDVMPSGVKVTAFIAAHNFNFYNNSLNVTVTSPDPDNWAAQIQASKSVYFLNTVPEIKVLPLTGGTRGYAPTELIKLQITSRDWDITLYQLILTVDMPSNLKAKLYELSLLDESGNSVAYCVEDKQHPGRFYCNMEVNIAAGASKTFAFMVSIASHESGDITVSMAANNWVAPCVNTFEDNINWFDGNLYQGSFFFSGLPLSSKIAFHG